MEPVETCDWLHEQLRLRLEKESFLASLEWSESDVQPLRIDLDIVTTGSVYMFPYRKDPPLMPSTVIAGECELENLFICWQVRETLDVDMALPVDIRSFVRPRPWPREEQSQHIGHSTHLCCLAEKGISLNLYKELVGNPKFVCRQCGRAAAKEENLCDPVPL